MGDETVTWSHSDHLSFWSRINGASTSGRGWADLRGGGQKNVLSAVIYCIYGPIAIGYSSLFHPLNKEHFILENVLVFLKANWDTTLENKTLNGEFKHFLSVFIHLKKHSKIQTYVVAKFGSCLCQNFSDFTRLPLTAVPEVPQLLHWYPQCKAPSFLSSKFERVKRYEKDDSPSSVAVPNKKLRRRREKKSSLYLLQIFKALVFGTLLLHLHK